MMTEKTQKVDWNRPVSKNSKSTARLKKFYTVLLIMAVAVFLLMHWIKKYAVEPKNIYSLIGNSVAVSVPVKTALSIREYGITPFKEFLEKGDYDNAYEMCSSYYKECFTVDDLREMFAGIDVSSIDLKEVKAKNDLCYEAEVVYDLKDPITTKSGDVVRARAETTFMIYPNEFNTEMISISPNGFLYGIKGQEFDKNGIYVYIEQVLVYNDHVQVSGKIRNTDLFSELSINSLGLGYETGLLRSFDYGSILQKNEEAYFEHTFEGTNYFMPNNFQVDKIKDEDTIRTFIYTFDTK